MTSILDVLPRPIELLDLVDGEAESFRVKAWKEGVISIFPDGWEFSLSQRLNRGEITESQARDLRATGKEIRALRVLTTPETEIHGAPYWDVTSTTLIAALKPYLEADGYQALKFTVTARGAGVSKRYALKVEKG